MSEVTDPEHLLNREYGKDLETRRWFILLAFSAFSASNAMLWITYSPITTAAQTYYDVSTDDIIQFSDAYMYVYFAFSFVGSWLAYRWFTPSLIIAMIINTAGAWLRFIAGTSYPLALVGQYLAAVAQNVVLFVPVLVADRWFSATERTWAVTLTTLANLLGWGFGFIFPTILIQGGYGELHHVTLYEAIIATVPLIIGVFSIRERPKVPPSYSAMVKMNDHDSFWHEVWASVKNVKFMVAAICFGNLNGQSYTLSSVIVLFIADASLMEQGLVGLTFVGCGILGGLAATAYLSKSKTENYDPILRIFMIISLVGLVVLALIIKKGMTGIFLLNAFLGVGLLGFQPFGAQVLVEMTFPVQESISVNFMMMMGQAFGVIGNSLTTASFVGDNGLWALTALILPCVIYITFFHKTEAKRLEAERQHKRIDKEGVSSILSSEER